MDAEEREAVRKSYRTLATGTEKVYMGIGGCCPKATGSVGCVSDGQLARACFELKDAADSSCL